MHELVETDVPRDAVAFAHEWRKRARADFDVLVEWNIVGHGMAVEGQVRDLASKDMSAFALGLCPGGTRRETVILRHAPPQFPATFVDVTLSLQRDGDSVSLLCDLPLTDREYFNGAIGEWRVTPADPAGDPATGGDASIQAPADAGDLFPFVWMQPLTRRQADELSLRFVQCPQPPGGSTAWPLYESLAAASSAQAKVQAAQAFRGQGGFVGALAQLGVIVPLMPQVRQQLLGMPGPLPQPELVEWLELALGLPLDFGLADYLASEEWQDAVSRLWQSLFAIALDGTAADAALSLQLGAALRLGQLMALAVGDASTTPPASSAEARRLLLCARLAFPDFVATQPPSPALRGGNADGRWEALGIGQLEVAQHRLLGYAAGELADVVNVMPRERQELMERSVLETRSREQTSHDRESDAAQRRERSESSELADAVAEVMAADGMLRNLSNVTPAYDNLNVSLSGSWSGAGGNAAWNRSGNARMARSITERASHRLRERASHRRGLEWQALREQRRSQLIDNGGHGRLVGLYHWVDRVVQVRLEPLGGRLVLAFELSQPARPWLQQLCRQGDAPLQPPPLLPAPKPGQPPYSVITADDYQALGAAYGLFDLEPPPPAQLTLVATVQRTTLGDLSLLVVPDGYSVTAGTATRAVADDRYAVACSVGGIDLAAMQPASAVALSVTVPSCASSTSVGAVSITPDADAEPVLATAAIAGIAGTTGAVPVTVMTAAPSFAVTVRLECRLAGEAASNPLVVSWQMRTHARLQRAWREASEGYHAAVRGRIAAAARHEGDVQRQVLQRACVSVLAPSTDVQGRGPRDLAPLLDWPHITWHYSQQAVDAEEAWPEPAPSQRMRPEQGDHLHAFLHAQSARVLVPALSGWEPWLLSLLQFPSPWAGGPADAPVTASTVALLEELAAPPPAERPRPWTLRVPTTLLYLQSGSQLPPLALAHRHD